MTPSNAQPRTALPRSRRRSAPGAPPGTVIVDPNAAAPKLSVVAYNDHDLVEFEPTDLSKLPETLKKWAVTWLNIDGLGDPAILDQLRDMFGLHPLTMEDAVNLHQRPKVEDYDDSIFLVTQMLSSGHKVDPEQLSLFLGRNFVVTLQEHSGDCLDPVRARLRQGRGRIRSSGADYLAYALLDAVIDGYFPILEAYGERVEELEDTALAAPTEDLAPRIHAVRRDLLAVRRAIWPQREMINELVRDEHPLITETTRVFLRDCYDHTIQLVDMTETYREVASGLFDLHLSSVSNRMNEIMKVLTIIATIFIPLGFIAGVYGMNFDPARSPLNMPELGWYWGYPFALAVMGAVAVGLLVLFWRFGWIGRRFSRRKNRVHDG